MKNIYRVRYKRGDVELDLESSDKEYIDKKLAEIQGAALGVAVVTGKAQPRSLRKKSGKTITQLDQSENGPVNETILVQIVANINDSDNYDLLAKRVLDQPDRTARILMCYYFAHKHTANLALTTGDIERVTSQLGIRIASSNIAKVIRQGASRYLTADRVRRRGLPVRYTINRRGIATFEEIIATQKHENN